MRKIPVGVSGRHVHVTKEALEILFGKGYELTKFKDLSQPGQYASNEKVTVVSPQGKTIEGVRILGPVRPEVQIEISRSDAIRGKFVAPVRASGDVKGSGACKLIGPKGELEVAEGVIVADRHIHFSLEEAKEFGVENNQIVKVLISGEKGGVFHNVRCRVSSKYRLDFHIDTDDAAAFELSTGDEAELIK